MSAQYIFTMHKVNRFYPPDREILKDVTLSFFPGAKIGVLGLNGSGKSTLLRIMAGVDKEFEGEARPQPGIKIGYLQQEVVPVPGQTVFEYIFEELRDKIESNKYKIEMVVQPLELDIRDRAGVLALLKAVKPAVVVHTAAQPCVVLALLLFRPKERLIAFVIAGVGFLPFSMYRKFSASPRALSGRMNAFPWRYWWKYASSVGTWAWASRAAATASKSPAIIIKSFFTRAFRACHPKPPSLSS